MAQDVLPFKQALITSALRVCLGFQKTSPLDTFMWVEDISMQVWDTSTKTEGLCRVMMTPWTESKGPERKCRTRRVRAAVKGHFWGRRPWHLSGYIWAAFTIPHNFQPSPFHRNIPCSTNLPTSTAPSTKPNSAWFWITFWISSQGEPQMIPPDPNSEYELDFFFFFELHFLGMHLQDRALWSRHLLTGGRVRKSAKGIAVCFYSSYFIYCSSCPLIPSLESV